MAKAKAKFSILKWNGKYSDGALFIIRNNQNQKRTIFSVGKLSDVAWTDEKLETLKEYAKWQDFEEEPINNLADIVF